MSSTRSLISVVVPSYNHANYIEAALQSVADQTYQEIELVVVDDRSSDATVAAAASWFGRSSNSSRFVRTRLLRNEKNIGAHATINRGIDESIGEYVAILNSDDLFAPLRLATLMNAAEESKSELAFSKVVPINDDGNILSPASLPHVLRDGVLDAADHYLATLPSIGFGFLKKNIAISTGNLLIRRSLFGKIGKFRPLKYVHDWDFILRSLIFNEPVYVPDELYFYRIHESNSFSQLSGVAELETKIAMQHFQDLARLRPIANELAPVEKNWPHIISSHQN